MQLQHSQLKTDVWHPNYNASVKRNRSILWGVKKWQHMPNAGNKEKHDLPFVAVFAMGLFEQTFQSQRVIFSTSCISCPVLGVKSLCTLLVTIPPLAPHRLGLFLFLPPALTWHSLSICLLVPSAKATTLFRKNTKAIVWGMQTRAVQGMLDFDYVCSREEPSVAAMVYPFT